MYLYIETATIPGGSSQYGSSNRNVVDLTTPGYIVARVKFEPESSSSQLKFFLMYHTSKSSNRESFSVTAVCEG